MQNEELANAIDNVKNHLSQLVPRIEIGSVVTLTDEDKIGIVMGMDAPDESDQPWVYSVYLVKVGDRIAESFDDVVGACVSGDRLAVIPPAPALPQVFITVDVEVPAEDPIAEFAANIAAFGWLVDYREFCQICKFDASTKYAKEKWEEFNHLQSGLRAFDLAKLEAIVAAGKALRQTSEVKS
jgi:hypothetical protein